MSDYVRRLKNDYQNQPRPNDKSFVSKKSPIRPSVHLSVCPWKKLNLDIFQLHIPEAHVLALVVLVFHLKLG